MFSWRRLVRGFTLIELMITLAIVALALTFVMPSATDWMRNLRIRGAAEEIMNEIMRTRTEAIKRNRQVGFQMVDNLTAACALAQNGTSWVISQYIAAGQCNVATSDVPDLTAASFATVQAADPLILSKGSVPLDANVSFNVYSVAGVNATGPIVFNAFGQLATPSLAAGARADIDVSGANVADCRPIPPAAGTGTLRCLRIRVSSSGQIRICDPSEVTVGDTRSCAF